MSDVRDTRLERLRKIKSLAENGCGGEKESAFVLYDKLKRLYELSDEDVAGLELFNCDFKWRTELGKKLLYQIIYMVVGNALIYEYPRKKKITVECTKPEEEEIRLCYSVYLPALERHIKDAYTAFVMTNDILPDADVRRPVDLSDIEISPERRKELDRASRLAKVMKRTVLPRALIDGK